MYSRISWATCGSLAGGSLRRSFGSSIAESRGLSVTGSLMPFTWRRATGRTCTGPFLPLGLLFPTLHDEASDLAQRLGRRAEALERGDGLGGEASRALERPVDAVERR